MLESMSMRNKPFSNHEEFGWQVGTPGHILGCIPPLFRQELFTSPAITVHDIAKEMRAEITNPEVHSEIRKALKDFEANYEIAETPYGWVRMSDAISMSIQLSEHYHFRGHKCPIKPEFIGNHDFVVNKSGPNEYYYLPNVENSILPEQAIVYKKRFYMKCQYITEYFEHEYAYRMPGEATQVCNNWYYGWHGN